jgi:predicted phosphodiesterase
MWAVLSDIHGNLEALQAVLADAEAHGVSAIYCLGDTVGYGPNPVECVRRSQDWELVLRGYCDETALAEEEPGGWSATSALASIRWARERLLEENRASLLNYLASRPFTASVDDFLFVHGTPRHPINEYLVPEYIYHPRKLDRVAECFEIYCFCGHTHVPGVFVTSGTEKWEYHSVEEIDHVWRLNARKTIVNVGSVGQPHDGDWRACYALVDDGDITFRRVEYDVETTVKKIYDNPRLADFQGDRLREGR